MAMMSKEYIISSFIIALFAGVMLTIVMYLQTGLIEAIVGLNYANLGLWFFVVVFMLLIFRWVVEDFFFKP